MCSWCRVHGGSLVPRGGYPEAHPDGIARRTGFFTSFLSVGFSVRSIGYAWLMIGPTKGIKDTREVLLSSLRRWPGNPRVGDVGGIKESLERYGQVRPLVVIEGGLIVAGNHTFEAMQELEWARCAVTVVNLTEQEAERYALLDNRLQDKASYNDEALIKILESIGDLAGTGYDQDDLEDLLSAIGDVPETATQRFEGDYAEPPEDTEARWADRNEGQRREVVFLLLESDFEHFRTLVEDLQRVWEQDTKAQTIYEAVQRCHREVGELAG